MEPLGTFSYKKKLTEQTKNRATSQNNKKIPQSFKTKKIMQPLGTKNHTTSQDKKIMQPLGPANEKK